ncbi:MAG: AAA family ATPase [Myxococcaceae bacterium]|nr:AAA family ATPase [Myxococcaceae bacterium]MBH2006504.1 AAA family ATPase [Myxococcaceae bacterium]
MQIRKLEIFGFKSFADRVIIQFDEGVTGIVGPNGCGKSNVVDALRWVMGEQNAKHLRGDQMQDIIFNGSQSRGAMGLAEVTLTLENDGQGVPQDYAHFEEIEITRRLYRNGESEYEINKRACRLRDITEFFLGTGVGTKAYSIIEQGRVSNIVQAKAEDRRNLIEEAAGITKYKVRKQAAERKMESTEQNLLRIQDITREVESRLETLEKQAEKASKHQALVEQIRALELHTATLQFFEYTNRLNFLSHQSIAQEQDWLESNQAIHTEEADFQEQRSRLLYLEEKLTLTQNTIHATESSIALANQDIAFSQSTLSSRQKQTLQIQAEMKRLSERLQELSENQSHLERQSHEFEQLASKSKADMNAQFEQVQALSQTRSKLRENQQQIQNRLLLSSRTATQSQSEVQELLQKGEQLKARTRMLDQELERINEQIQDHDSQKSNFVTEIDKVRMERNEANQQISILQEELRALQPVSAEKASLKQKQVQRIALNEGRLSAVLESLQENKKPEHRNYKHLADEFDIPEAYESLVEDACSARLEAYLVASFEEGLELAKHGRIRFLPKDTKPFQFEIVRDSSEARIQWPEAIKNNTILITESGELFDTDRSCVAGAKTKSGGLLAKRRESQSLQSSLNELAKELSMLESDLHQLDQRKQSIHRELDAQRSVQQALLLTLARLEEGFRNQESTRRSLSQRLQQLNAEREKNASLSPDTDSKLEKLQKQRAQALDHHQALEMQLKEVQDEASLFEQRFVQDSETLTKRRIEAASALERQNNLIRSQEQLAKNQDDIRIQVRNLENQLLDFCQDEVQLNEQISIAQKKLETATQELQTFKIAHQEQKKTNDEKKTQIREIETKLGTKRQEMEQSQKTLTKLQLEMREQELGLQNLDQRLYEKYQVWAHEILSDYHHRSRHENSAYELGALKRQVEHLGPIHLEAIQEFREMEKRYQFLKAQGDDLTQALEQLQAAIHKINDTTKQRFDEAFRAINERFSHVFPRLFRGGKAWLQLTDPSDLLNTGVEIFAQPPGKKLASIALMSGGEKALTATSLIFAIFLMKPSPFCLLDEVDAPLDEANVDRFSTLVQEMSKVSQFIVITHNKRTMEQSDRLYGITMEQPGISKAVNVRVKQPNIQS